MNHLRRGWGGLVRLSGSAAAVAATLGASEGKAAVADRVSSSINGGAGYATNPFFRQGPDTAAGFVTLSVTPSYLIEEERGQVRLEGTLRATHYLSKYGDSYAYGARTWAERQLSETATVTASAQVESSIVGQEPAFAPPGLPPLPAAPLEAAPDQAVEEPLDELFDPIDPDIALAGQRRTSLSAEIAANLRVGPAGSINFVVQTSKLIFPASGLGTGSRSLSGSASYSRRLSGASSVGISGFVQRTLFAGDRESSTVYQPQIFYSGQVDSGWTFSLAAGGLFISSQTAAGEQRSSGFSGDASACRNGIRSSVCFGASRGAEESGLGVINERTSVFTRLSYRLSDRENISVGGALAKSEQASIFEDRGRRQQSVEADYRLQLRERWDIGVTAAYKDIYGGEGPIAADFRAEVTFSIRLGR